MIESKYTQAIHKKLPKHIYKWKIGDKLVGGVPDAFYRNLQSKNGKPLWVEYKLIKTLPKRPQTVVKPDLSENQKIWLRQAVLANEQAWVILGCENIAKTGVRSFIFTEPDQWENGETCENLRAAEWLDYTGVSHQIVEKTS